MPPLGLSKHFQYLVLGGGSGGIASARRAAEFGVSVALIENGPLGGTCVSLSLLCIKLGMYEFKANQSLCFQDVLTFVYFLSRMSLFHSRKLCKITNIKTPIRIVCPVAVAKKNVLYYISIKCLVPNTTVLAEINFLPSTKCCNSIQTLQTRY
jgi:hypothetical protein